MKKLFYTIASILFVFLFLIGANKADAAGISVSVSPSAAKVGEKVTFTINVASAPAEAYYVEMFISDFENNGDAGTLKTFYVKQTYSFQRAPATFNYEWDTSLSAVGEHDYYAAIEKSNHDVLDSSEMKTYTLSASGGITPTPGSGGSATPTPGGGGGGTTPIPGGSLTPTPATSGGASIGGFYLGKLGKIVFPTTKVNSAKELLVVIINWMVWLMGILAVVAIVYSGIMYITAAGDTAKAEAARKNLTWAVIGLVIVLLSLVMISYIHKVVG